MGAFRGSGSILSPFKPKRAPLFIPRLLLGLDKVQGWESKVIRVYGFRLSVFISGFRAWDVEGLEFGVRAWGVWGLRV